MAARRSRRPAGAAVSGWPSRGDANDWPFPRRSPRPHKPPAPAPPSVGLPRREGGPVMPRITIHLGGRERLEARISKATPLGALGTEALVYLGSTCLGGPAPAMR